MDGEDEAEHQQLLSRRDRLRAQRQAAHSAPARVRLRLGAVIVIIAALLSWLLVSFLSSATSSGEALPEPPRLEDSSSERPVEHPEAAQQSPGSEADVDPAEPVVVHVAGAVREPQVVEIEAGARTAEAIEAAGGLTEDAAAQGLNLAAEITDGSYIWVPTVEEFDEGAPGPPAAAEPEAGQGAQDAPININTSGAEQLEELSGVGPALAERIISYRETNGGFSSLDELAAVSGIGPSIIENIADDVDW